MMATETVKKAKSPAKTKKVTATAVASAEAAPKATKKKAAPKSVAARVKATTPTHEEIARLAQQYWIERGWQDGYAEQDWLRAEQELMGMAS
jgi:Protein of unknown function (DUF2934)